MASVTTKAFLSTADKLSIMSQEVALEIMLLPMACSFFFFAS